MLKTSLCVIIALAAAGAWEQMLPVSYPAEVQTGSAITYGDGKVWGIFPDPSDSSWTYFEYYDPSAPGGSQWVYLGQDYDLWFLGDPAITFQWRFGGEVLVVGNEDGDPDYPMLYCYALADSSWDEEDIDDFSLGAGASIAFRPASAYYGTYVAGWMYCLAGGGDEFWCYSVPGPGDVMFDGICPGETALIADNTPTFIWSEVQGTQMYKLTISPNPDMYNPVLEDSTGEPSYEVTEALNNGVYYWQSASRQGATWTASAVHSFTLEGGWTPLADIPMGVSYGASLAYEEDFYSGEQRLLALTGGWYYYTYSVAGDTWYEFTTPKAQGVGSAVVTHEAAGPAPENWPYPWVMFGGSDSLYYHYNSKPEWIYRDAAPQTLGSGASMAYSIESDTPYLYLTVGEDGNGPRNDFYRLELPASGGGGQARPTSLTSLRAKLVGGSDKVTVEYQLSAPAQVKATVFDAAGRQVTVLDAGLQSAGIHEVRWETETSDHRTSAGTYFVLLDTGTEQARLKAVVR
jgi:hypothetical protein